MRVLVACEFSGRVRDAFKTRGHDAWSCDLKPSEQPGQHIQGDAIEAIRLGWDLIIAHPECTYLTVAANGWHKKRFSEREPLRNAAAKFFMAMYDAPCPRVCVENPIGVMSALFRKPDQIVQPWQFGHPERKATCFWLRGLPLLSATTVVEPEKPRGVSPKGTKYYSMNSLPGSSHRATIRSRTFTGIAEAMAKQWG